MLTLKICLLLCDADVFFFDTYEKEKNTLLSCIQQQQQQQKNADNSFLELSKNIFFRI